MDIRRLQLKTCPSCDSGISKKDPEREPRRDGKLRRGIRTGRSARYKPVASAFGPARPAGGFCRGATLRQSGEVQGQAILIAVMNDEAFLAGVEDGQIGGTLGALGLFDELLTERIESRWRAGGQESELNIGRFDFSAGCSRGRRSGTGSGKPERVGIQR